jgi:outer membrane protein OmpA-like peptidoglycan-associated protein
MSSKRYSILLGFIALMISTGVTAQVASYDWRDSSLIPSSRAAQHNEFMNNQYYYPAKPRNQWEIGAKIGTFNILGDVPSNMFNLGFGYMFSLRLEYMHGSGKGQHWQQATNYGKNPAWSTGMQAGGQYIADRVDGAGNRIPAQDIVFYNYKTSLNDLGLQGMFSLNNIRFHKGKIGTNIYALGGIGITWYESSVNALNGNAKYDFSTITIAQEYKNRNDIKDEIRDLLDDSYETAAESYGNNRMKLFGNTARPSATIGAGVAFKLGKKVNLAIEDRFTFVTDDLLDGQRWQESAFGDAVLTRNFDSYNFLSVGLNVNLGSKSVEPLYWLNPLDFAYSELNSPKRMLIPKPVLDDADGDGVTDQFDNEPNTPAGAPVDTHGVSKDTDGDGVPDYKDKQLITPTECQPVDADGVGKCPDPECCKNMVAPKSSCAIGDLPSISFKGNSAAVSKDAEAVLATVADRMRNNPTCKVVVTGYGEPSKASQQLSWDRVNAVINHMVDKQGISIDRFVFRFGQAEGDPNTVDLRAAGEGEEGPNTVPAPHPNLRKK